MQATRPSVLLASLQLGLVFNAPSLFIMVPDLSIPLDSLVHIRMRKEEQ